MPNTLKITDLTTFALLCQQGKIYRREERRTATVGDLLLPLQYREGSHPRNDDIE